MTKAAADPSSFRDPGGRVYLLRDRVFRTVTSLAVENYEFVAASGVLKELESKGWVIPSNCVDPAILGEHGREARYVLEHPKLPFVSYPYEWSFSALKAAALLHLDIQLVALEGDVALSDATAYNVQFIGSKPIFIDRLSFVRYHDGELWVGHRQFCEQFLNPLLLRALVGVPHNSWYRGAYEGIPTDQIRRLIPWRKKLSWHVLIHVVLQSVLQSSTRGSELGLDSDITPTAGLPRPRFRHMLEKLRNWISGLNPADTGKTVWHDYATQNIYTSTEAAAKHEYVRDFVSKFRPRMIWDLGCNTGDYSVTALDAGAHSVIGFDFDHGALEQGFDRAARNDLAIQFLFMDGANPSSAQGWAEAERRGLEDRACADAVLALAFVHHMAIAKNIPLDRLLAWIVRLAPTGVVEFVPKQDQMVQRLLRHREDIFPDYTEECFLASIRRRAKIDRMVTVSESGRLLVSYCTPR